MTNQATLRFISFWGWRYPVPPALGSDWSVSQGPRTSQVAQPLQESLDHHTLTYSEGLVTKCMPFYHEMEPIPGTACVTKNPEGPREKPNTTVLLKESSNKMSTNDIILLYS